MSTVHIKQLLQLDDKTKKITLNGQRMILIGADALGTLRKDLISALGMERAKSFLLRYGWHCGLDYAKYMKMNLSFDNLLDWLNFGPQIHEMSGNAAVYLKNQFYDPHTHRFKSEGYWYHSYEAEQHIKHFGYHDEPVCYTLTGFASGYVSYHLGKNVLFKEIACVGKGDPYCHWISKSSDFWDDELGSEINFYKEESLIEELDKAYLRIEKQKEMFRRALKISEELSKILLKREGLLPIIKILGEHLNTSVVIEDINFKPIELVGQYRIHDLESFIKNPPETQKHRVNELINQKSTVHLSIPQLTGWSHERLITPILVKNEVIGYLSLIKSSDQFTHFNEMERIALERGATMCAIHMLNERIAIEITQRLKGDILNELIDGNANSETFTRMKSLGYDFEQPHYLFLFHLDYVKEVNDETHLLELKKQLSDEIYNKLKEMGQISFVSSKLDQIIALVPQQTLKNLQLKPQKLGILLLQKVAKKFQGFTISLGISSVCYQLSDYKDGYQQAKKCIEILKLMKEPTQVVAYDQLGLITKLCSEQNITELRNYSLDLLNHLIQYDQNHQAELLKTLYIYLNSNGNILETSRKMTLSTGAIKYRLKRIEEISGLDLTKSTDLFDAYAALQILILLGDISI